MHGFLTSDSLDVEPITGRTLAHSRLTAVDRAFVAADLHSDRRRLILPTQRQSALLAGCSVGYALLAARASAAERAEILAGRKPLTSIGQDLAELARRIGAERWLAAGVAAGL